MDSERRQELNLHVIRVSFEAAVRSLPAEMADQAVGRANALLDGARSNAVTPAIRRKIDALQGELYRQARANGLDEEPG